MKSLRLLFILSLAGLAIACNNTGKKTSGSGSNNEGTENDTFKVHVARYPNDNIKTKSEAIKVKRDGKDTWIPHGRQWNYYERTGNLQSIVIYKNGKREGVATYFYGDGETKYREIPYVNSKKEGIVKKFYESGNLQSETPYKSDMLGTGSQDYADRKEDAALTMPELKVWADDNRRAKGTYTVYAKVVDKFGKTEPNVEFLQGMLLSADGRKYEHPGLKKMKVKNNIGSVTFYESQGFPGFVSVSARLSTNKGTAVLLNKVHTIN